jgi:endonuclease/exonuclease/phosphatase family metal-dependent hydrolase
MGLEVQGSPDASFHRAPCELKSKQSLRHVTSLDVTRALRQLAVYQMGNEAPRHPSAQRTGFLVFVGRDDRRVVVWEVGDSNVEAACDEWRRWFDVDPELPAILHIMKSYCDDKRLHQRRLSAGSASDASFDSGGGGGGGVGGGDAASSASSARSRTASSDSDVDVDSGSSSGDEREPLTVISYNIRHAKGMDGKVDTARIADVIRRSGAHVALLQEVDRNMPRTQRRDITAELATALGWAGVFDANLRTAAGGQYGNALLSSLPITSWRNHVYEQTRAGEPRGLLVATVTWHGREVDVLTTHLDASADDAERAHQAGLLRDALLCLSAERPFILAGDFNAPPDAAALTPLRQCWTDVWGNLGEGAAGATFPSDSPRYRIDHFWCNVARTRPVSVRVLESLASDHRPLVASFVVVGARRERAAVGVVDDAMASPWPFLRAVSAGRAFLHTPCVACRKRRCGASVTTATVGSGTAASRCGSGATDCATVHCQCLCRPRAVDAVGPAEPVPRAFAASEPAVGVTVACG